MSPITDSFYEPETNGFEKPMNRRCQGSEKSVFKHVESYQLYWHNIGLGI